MPRKFPKSISVRRGKGVFQNTYSPQAYAITVAKLKALGKPIPKGSELNDAVKKESDHRINAAGFMSAGWLAAIKVFANKIGKPTRKYASRFLSRFGYGGARAATPSNHPFTEFWNMAASRHTTAQNGKDICEDGLKAAMNQTAIRMREYVAKKQQQRGEASMRKFLR